MKNIEICVDCDGTMVTHEYPKMGRDIGAAPVLKRLTDAGHKLILFTMRSGKELRDAENWFKENGIPLYGSNTNPTQKRWTSSPKAYGQLYIDDAALGIPLIVNGVDRPYVDWQKVEIMLEKMGLLSKTIEEHLVETIENRIPTLIERFNDLNDYSIITIVDNEMELEKGEMQITAAELKHIIIEETKIFLKEKNG